MLKDQDITEKFKQNQPEILSKSTKKIQQYYLRKGILSLFLLSIKTAIITLILALLTLFIYQIVMRI